tara:strand:- start:285 stop:464 length:180 start_codon:yes stop_codon:yes gene_type:complete
MDNKNNKAKIIKTYYTPEGTLYQDSIVSIETVSTLSKKSKVKDNTGKIYFVESKHLVKL